MATECLCLCLLQAANCSSCCLIPVSLEIQVLWALTGLQSNPQAHVTGAQFLYQCKSVQVSQVPSSPLVTRACLSFGEAGYISTQCFFRASPQDAFQVYPTKVVIKNNILSQ